MNFGNLNRIIFLLFAMANCISCTITFGPQPSELPVDYSFPVTGEVLEANIVSSVIEQRLLPWGRKPFPEANISLTGVIRSGTPFLTIQTFLLLPTVKLKYQDDDTNWLLPHYLQKFRWNGTIAIDGHSENTTIGFDVYGNNDGHDKHFILTGATLGQTYLECDDPIEIYADWEGSFPFLVGYAYLPDNKYGVYAVIDDSSRTIIFEKEIFFSPSQKFQFLDERDTVVAELKSDRYTIYDTISEAETVGLKQAIALLVAYRHAASVLRSRDGWELDTFYRYVYK